MLLERMMWTWKENIIAIFCFNFSVVLSPKIKSNIFFKCMYMVVKLNINTFKSLLTKGSY